MFRHIVCFKLKQEEKDKASEAANRLRSLIAIPEVKAIDVGIDELKSARSYDIALVVDFDSRSDYEIYDKHELHQPVRQFMHSVVETSVAADFEREQ